MAIGSKKRAVLSLKDPIRDQDGLLVIARASPLELLGSHARSKAGKATPTRSLVSDISLAGLCFRPGDGSGKGRLSIGRCFVDEYSPIGKSHELSVRWPTPPNLLGIRCRHGNSVVELVETVQKTIEPRCQLRLECKHGVAVVDHKHDVNGAINSVGAVDVDSAGFGLKDTVFSSLKADLAGWRRLWALCEIDFVSARNELAESPYGHSPQGFFADVAHECLV